MGKGSNPGLRARGHVTRQPAGPDSADQRTARDASDVAGDGGSGPAAEASAPADTADISGEPGRKRRLDLNVPQVAGSAAAAVLAAKFASNLGVYGTILGAGVVSAIATFSGSVFQHFFRRTGEQIRDAAVQARPRARQVPVPMTSGGHPVPETFRTRQDEAVRDTHGSPAVVPGADPTMALYATDLGTGPGAQLSAFGPDADPTALLPFAAPSVLPGPAADPALPGEGPAAPGGHSSFNGASQAAHDVADGARQNSALPERAAYDGAPRALHPYDEVARLLPRISATRLPGRPDASRDGLLTETFTEGTVHHARIRGVKRPLIAAGLVFAVTMGGITSYELASGHSFSGGRTGTTIGNVFSGGGHSGSGRTPTAPASTPSVQQSDGSGDADQKSGSARPSTDAPQDQDQQTAPAPDPTSTHTDGSGSGTDSGSHDTTVPGSGGRQTPTPTPTPTSTQDDGTGTSTDGGSGTDTGGWQQYTSSGG